MDRICLGVGVWMLSIFISFVCPLHGATIDVSESVGRLVEADWIRADIEFDSSDRNSIPATDFLWRIRTSLSFEGTSSPIVYEACLRPSPGWGHW